MMETILELFTILGGLATVATGLGHLLPGKAGQFCVALGFDIQKLLKAVGK